MWPFFQVKFAPSITGISGKSRKHCSHSEPYFLEQLNTNYTHQFTVTKDGKDKERVLPAGIHHVPFSYTLPKSLPTSFEGEFGHIRYTCKAICERPWDFDIVTRKAFTVIGIEDINSDAKLNEPTSASESNHTVKFCCRSSGSVTGELKLPKAGYTPGEKIDLCYRVTNNSSKSRNVTVRFVQVTTYKAKTFAGHEHVKCVKRVVNKADEAEVGGDVTTDWLKEEIVISIAPATVRKVPDIVGGLYGRVGGGASPNHHDPSGNRIDPSTFPAFGPFEKLDNQWDPTKKNDSGVQVTITDESGQVVEDLSDEMEALMSSRKRVRMPSSILSELYPSMPSPYYRESYFGPSDIAEEKEQVQFGENIRVEMRFAINTIALLLSCTYLVQAKKVKPQKVVHFHPDGVQNFDHQHVHDDHFRGNQGVNDQNQHQQTYNQNQQQQGSYGLPRKSQFKQVTAYDQCKMECRKLRDAAQRKEYVEYLRSELNAAEAQLEEERRNTEEQLRDDHRQHAENMRSFGDLGDVEYGKQTRFEHLRNAGQKIVETGAELKNVVTGGRTAP
ncbi:unnamed protein product [Caenorhabditis auriculariae]|uniref:Arrestin C-terminal-like domain-containing protein n=1 Tax=Caenorhabditis auriculariae TaxID=2777116 RepID=A0A8S1GQM6_9PELO|nr:unnamed protein product [Caenorhabditis auriculariae]